MREGVLLFGGLEMGRVG